MSPALLLVLLMLAACVPQGPTLPGDLPDPQATPTQNPGDDPSNPTDPTDPTDPGGPTDPSDPPSQTWYKPVPNLRYQILDEDDGDYIRQLKSNTSIVTIEAVKDDYSVLAQQISALHAKGVRVICYQSLSYEPWRDDIKQFPKSAVGKKMSGWDEWWTDTRVTSAAHPFWDKRYEQFAKAGCDCVEDDNMVDPNDNATGFPLTKAQGKAAINRRADKAHELKMCYIAKNNPSMSADYATFSDGVFIEEAGRYDERDSYLPWKTAKKFGAMIEYSKSGCKPYAGFSVQYHSSGDYFDGVKYTICD